MSATPLVLVTGVSGYIASWVAHAALKVGYRVRGTVRSLADEKKVQHLRNLCPGSRYQIELVEADLTSDVNWDVAVAGCTYILHVASPFPLEEPKDPDELIRPAVEGTLRILKAASESPTRPHRVVVTSSVAAMAYGQKKEHFDDTDWTELINPQVYVGAYPKSKTLAEKAAWDFVGSLPEDKRFELCTVNPSFVLGAMLSTAQCSSAQLLKQLAMGEIPALPDLSFNVVSVYDVARAHLLAMTHPQAAGKRFMCSASEMGFRDIAAILCNELKPYGYRPTSMHVPSFVMHVMAFFGDKLAAAATPMLGIKQTHYSSNTRSVLGLQLREDKEAIVREMLYAAIHAGVIPDRSADCCLTREYERPVFDTSMIPQAP